MSDTYTEAPSGAPPTLRQRLGDSLRSVQSTAKTKVANAKGRAKSAVVDGLKKRIIDAFRRVYLEKAKPMLTQGDKHMPMGVRRAIHDVADSFWWALMQELPETIDLFLETMQQRRQLEKEYKPMLRLDDSRDDTYGQSRAMAAIREARERLGREVHTKLREVHTRTGWYPGMLAQKAAAGASRSATAAGGLWAQRRGAGMAEPERPRLGAISAEVPPTGAAAANASVQSPPSAPASPPEDGAWQPFRPTEQLRVGLELSGGVASFDAAALVGGAPRQASISIRSRPDLAPISPRSRPAPSHAPKRPARDCVGSGAKQRTLCRAPPLPSALFRIPSPLPFSAASLCRKPPLRAVAVPSPPDARISDACRSPWILGSQILSAPGLSGLLGLASSFVTVEFADDLQWDATSSEYVPVVATLSVPVPQIPGPNRSVCPRGGDAERTGVLDPSHPSWILSRTRS